MAPSTVAQRAPAIPYPEQELGRITTRVLRGLADHDPRAALVPQWVATAAGRLESAPVRRHSAVLIERAVHRELQRPHAMERAAWRRRTPSELRLRKWDGSPGRLVPLQFERHDQFGRWYRWPAGEATLPGTGPPRAYASDFVQLVPTSGSWIARWGDDGEYDVYCDVTSRPAISAGPGRDATVTAIDLDLDVVRRHDGTIEIIDQDQFARRQVEMNYPPEVVTEALATAAWLRSQLIDRVEPFGSVGSRLLSTRST